MGYFDDVSEKEANWLKEKWACFSASKIHCLTVSGTRPMTKEELKNRPTGCKDKTVPTTFGKAALTYIETIATQAYSIFNLEEAGFESRAMRTGKMNEPASFYAVEKNLGLSGKGVLQYCGGDNPIFKKYTEDSGASPDFIAPAGDGKYAFGGELKNPNSTTHFRYLRKMRTAASLKIIEPDYYGQCQFAMMAFDCPFWFFASYNEYIKEYADRLLLIKVNADKAYQNNLKLRLKMASKLKSDWIKEAEKGRLTSNE